MTTTTPPAAAGPRRDTASEAQADTRLGDRIFRAVTASAGVTVLLLVVAIATFLVIKALPALRANSGNFVSEREWLPDGAPPIFGIAALAVGSVVTSLIALVVGLPIALSAALFITEIAPRRLAGLLGALLDLLAAVPSVVYGLWGFLYLVPRMSGLQLWLGDRLGFIPIFHNEALVVGRSIFAASVVLAIMIIPIVAAIAREVFLQVPIGDREAAMALGATRWEAIRLAVLPFSRPGVIGAAMLGLGRALGETIAVALVISASFDISANVLKPGGNTIAANIATKFGAAETTGRGALIASGLVLFIITLLINMAARAIVSRSEAQRVRV